MSEARPAAGVGLTCGAERPSQAGLPREASVLWVVSCALHLPEAPTTG